MKKISLCIALAAGTFSFSPAQINTPYFKEVIKENRDRFYTDACKAIISNLSETLTEETEADWISAFSTINLLQYENPFMDAKIKFAVNHINNRSNDFKKAMIEVLYCCYPNYAAQVKNVFLHAGDDPLLMVMAGNYLLTGKSTSDTALVKKQLAKQMQLVPANTVLAELWHQLTDPESHIPAVNDFFSPSYLPGHVLVFSFQRHDRNFPGLVVVRDSSGHFIKNDDGSFFSAGQLARSESNMPGYISMGNTPQGIFRMDGFDTSKNFFIGPVTNVQLTMPFEYKASHFYDDGTLIDSVWTVTQYAKLLPDAFKNYRPMFGTFYAGKAGRTEIIAHGTTIDPRFSLNRSYYPYTPSAGCLVTKEIWDEKTGYLQSSDQLRLVRAIQKAGGPHGYLIVIEFNDDKKPVLLQDVELMMN